MRTTSRFLSQAWRPAMIVVGLGLMAYLLYFNQLNTLLPGYAPAEISNYHSALTWHAIVHNPLNAPYKLGVLLLAITGHHQPIIARAVAAFCGTAAVAAFFCIARAWYGSRVAFFGTVMFASSAGLLHNARLGSPAILQMSILLLIGVLLWHRRAPRWHPYLTYAVILVAGLLWYVPGMVWFELLAAGLMHRAAFRHWQRSLPLHRYLWVALFVMLVAPLVTACVLHSNLALLALGLPHSLHALDHVGSNLLNAVLTIGVRSNGNPLLWVGHSPLLNVIELAFAAFGTYYYIHRERSLRSILLAGSVIICLALASLGITAAGLAPLIPLLYLLIAAGLKHFLDEWLTVFPRNPIARGTGLVVIGIMLFFSVFYQVRSYFVAWPHDTATRKTFHLPRS